MRWLGFIVAAVALVCGIPAAAKPLVQVTLSRAKDAAGGWIADYRFYRAAPVWFFGRSNPGLDGKPWRPKSWTVETPGVRLDHAGSYDVLVGDGDAPLTKVRIRIQPYTEKLRADYTPVLAFSDGGLAFYSDHFNVSPMPSRAAVAALPDDLNGIEREDIPTEWVIRDPGHRLLMNGKTYQDRARMMIDRAETYMYDGAAPIVETAAFAGVFDPGLPAWVRGELESFTPRLMGLYTRQLGAPVTPRPMALIAWEGAEKDGWSMGGSVLDGMVVMQISGKRVANRSPEAIDPMRWFIAHESAHFWMGQTVRYARSNEGWILEGAADLLAVRALERLIPDYDGQKFLQTSMDQCLDLNGAGKPLSDAERRDAHRAFYACGAMLLVAEEGMAGGKDVFALLHDLIAAHRAKGEVSAAQWFAQFATQTGDAARTDRIRTFVNEGVADPADFWSDLLTAAHVAHWRDGARIHLGARPEPEKLE